MTPTTTPAERAAILADAERRKAEAAARRDAAEADAWAYVFAAQDAERARAMAEVGLR